MNWIKLILNNWFIVVVLFFVISSLLKRKNTAARHDPKRPAGPSMPPFGGGGQLGSGWGKKTPEMNKGKTAPAATSPVTRTITTTEVSRDSLSQRDGRLTRSASEASNQGQERRSDFWDTSPINGSPAALRAGYEGAEDTPSSRPGPLDANKLAQGILWAEILGPPRSKKPFRK